MELGFVRISFGKAEFARRTIPFTARFREVHSRRVLEAKSEWLFPIPWDSMRPLSSVRKTHEAALQRSGIKPHLRLYDLRHTALTRMAMADVAPPILRELAGHASIQMIMRCLHLTPAHKKNAISQFEGFCRTDVRGAEVESTVAL